MLVITGCGALEGKDQQNDAADEGNQSDQCPPTALIRVVKASDEYSQCWHDSGQRPDQADDATRRPSP